jgi:hypothetical protein
MRSVFHKAMLHELEPALDNAVALGIFNNAIDFSQRLRDWQEREEARAAAAALAAGDAGSVGSLSTHSGGGGGAAHAPPAGGPPPIQRSLSTKPSKEEASGMCCLYVPAQWERSRGDSASGQQQPVKQHCAISPRRRPRS